jgi:hypothetical protein
MKQECSCSALFIDAEHKFVHEVEVDRKKTKIKQYKIHEVDCPLFL